MTLPIPGELGDRELRSLEVDALISAEVAYTATGGSVNTKRLERAIDAYLSSSPILERLASAWHAAGGHPTEELMIAVRDAAALAVQSKQRSCGPHNPQEK